MKLKILLFAFISLLFSCSENTDNNSDDTANKAVSETDRLNSWFEEKYAEQLRFSPIELTFQGSKELYGQINDFSKEAEKENLQWQIASLEELEDRFNYELLDAEAQTSYDLWKYRVELSIEGEKYSDHDYLFEQMDGFHTFLPTFLMSFHEVESVSDLEAYIQRIDGIGNAITRLLERAEKASKQGVRPPAFSYEFVLDESRKLISGQPFEDSAEDAPVWANVQEKVQSLLDSEALTEEQAAGYKEKAAHHLRESFGPAYRDLISFVEEDSKNTTAEPNGVSALPDGENYYNYMLSLRTTTELSADDIHNLGLQEVERLRKEMIELKDATGFEGDLQSFFAFIRDSIDDDRFYYPDTDDGRKAYIDDATQAIENIKSQLPGYFGLLPKADLIVKRVEPFREQPGAAQHYFPSTPDGSRPGIYYAHLSDMKAMPKNQLEVIAYHEALPGHHMQIAIAQEKDDLPRFRRQGGYTAYVEGWALYSELLAKEIPGTYQDHYSDFGRLSTEIWRAIRLVVDTGLHAKGWSEQQAVDYFAANSPEPLASIRSEVQRYLVLPGQATSYKIGMLKILELRAKAQEALGEAFDIRAFHDQILGGGALPLSLLEKRIDRWLESQK